MKRDGQRLWCYSSGDGSLSLVWNVAEGGNMVCSGRKTTLGHIRAFLRLKEERHLTERGWVPANINGCWLLARKVKRTGKNRLNVGGRSYTYKINLSRFGGDVNHTNLTVWFRYFEHPRQWVRHHFKNESELMVIRYFLNHEKELTPIFAGAERCT
jgi:hypothetical protein